MNLGNLFLLFGVAIAAIFGIIMIGSTHSTPYVDSYNTTFTNTTNTTLTLVNNMSATGTQIGGGIVILIALAIGVVVLLALAIVAAKRF